MTAGGQPAAGIGFPPNASIMPGMARLQPHSRMRFMILATIGLMVVLSVRDGIRFQRMLEDSERAMRRAMQECRSGNEYGMVRMLQFAISAAPDSGSDASLRELNHRFRKGDCARTQVLTSDIGFVEAADAEPIPAP